MAFNLTSETDNSCTNKNIPNTKHCYYFLCSLQIMQKCYQDQKMIQILLAEFIPSYVPKSLEAQINWWRFRCA